jgi:hypothetical protein
MNLIMMSATKTNPTAFMGSPKANAIRAVVMLAMIRHVTAFSK